MAVMVVERVRLELELAVLASTHFFPISNDSGNAPTLTDVLPSSSDALLPAPGLLLTLIRLDGRLGWKMPLIGRAGGGDAGGLAIPFYAFAHSK